MSGRSGNVQLVDKHVPNITEIVDNMWDPLGIEANNHVHYMTFFLHHRNSFEKKVTFFFKNPSNIIQPALISHCGYLGARPATAQAFAGPAGGPVMGSHWRQLVGLLMACNVYLYMCICVYAHISRFFQCIM